LLPNLTSSDLFILVLYLLSVLIIGFSLRSNIKSAKDFLQAGRSLPTWVCTLAFLAASLGSVEVVAMGAAGAQFGLKAIPFFVAGSVPALLFSAIYMIPLYFSSGARTVPEYLGLRFDRKTRLLQAGLFALGTLLSAGLSLYLMARLLQALRVFDFLFFSYSWPRQGIFTFCLLLPAAVVLAYVLFSGLAGAMVNQALQFALLVAGLLPVVFKGLENIGGWSGLTTTLHTVYPLHETSLAHSGATLAMLAGLVLATGYWTTDFRVLQTAMAAKDANSARRVSLFAAVAMLLIPLLLILPGIVAVSLPTPHTSTVVREENGAIFHEITVVPREVAAGQGLVPARIGPAAGNPLAADDGHPLLDYDRATPNILLHLLPTGLLGLGLAALLACFMSGLAASLTAFIAVVACDLLPSLKTADDRRPILIARLAAIFFILLAISVAYVLSATNTLGFGFLDALLLGLSLLNASQLATFLLGMFSKRATGHGAFAGLAAGTLAAILHYGLTLPADASPGLHGGPGLYGGWLAVLHRYPSFIAECFWTALLALAINFIVASAVSLCTKAGSDADLKGLVHGSTPAAR
jgi:SSS family solute:Na+ symporter